MVGDRGAERRAFVLDRPRLFETLDRARQTSMTLVVAPAGYGKSELLRGWVAKQTGSGVVSVALDERDNDPGRFWQALIGELTECVPSIGQRPVEIAQLLTPGSIEILVEATCTALARVETEIIIVLDDFHFIDHPAVLDSIDLFRDEMPPSVHLVIGGRQDPRLPMSRLRLRGDLVEVREADLQFTESETAALLTGSGFRLDESDVALLQQRTEGWCAALRLAILSMGQASDPAKVVHALSGSDQALADYLLEEVVSEMEPARREFLVSTCVCDEVNGPLGEALSGRDDAANVLARLATEGVFTTAATSESGWFRYHRLLRDLLRARLRANEGARYSELNRRAARWHHEHGDGAMSVQHALEAGEIGDASRWLGEIGPTLASTGRATTVEELSARIMDASPEPNLMTMMTRWWALYMIGEPRNQSGQPEIEGLGQRLQDTLDALPDDDEPHDGPVDGSSPTALSRPSSKHYVRALRARSRGDTETVLALDDPAVIPSPSGRVEGFLAEGLLWHERAQAARPLISVFLEHGEIDGYSPTAVHGLGLDSMASVISGDLGRAREEVARARRITEDNGFGDLVQTMYSRLVSTWLAWLAGDLSEAEDTAVRVQRYCEVALDVPIVAQHALMRSRIRWSLGDSLGARSLLDRATMTSGGRPVEGYFAHRLNMGRVMLDLLDGELPSAERMMPDWRARLEAGPDTMRERLLLLRMLISANGDLAQVHKPVPRDAEVGPLHEIELGRLRAMAFLQQGRADDATSVLARSLHEAQRLGALQPSLDDRAPLAPILAAAAREAKVALPGLTDGAESPATVYVEPLSKREITVLELMATHMTYAEIADQLFISPNTVRAHVGAVFRKLAVNRRSEAVTQGRAYGLIK